MATRITLKTESYNPRRYSKPWIAVVDFSNTPRGEFKWGSWVGDPGKGSEGLLVVEADEGDIVATGQKDFRRPMNSSPTYYQIRDGQLVELTGKAEAYQLAIAR